MSLSKSPDRNTFQRDAYIKRCEVEGKEPNPEYIKMYNDWDAQADANMQNPEYIKNNLEYELRTTDWILEKVRNDDIYAQHLYAAICNNDFQKLDPWPILKGETCGYSWRYAGGIIADMQQKGDYIDWYCSGIKDTNTTDEEYLKMTEEQQTHYKHIQAYVNEGCATDEIKQDLLMLGWTVLDQ